MPMHIYRIHFHFYSKTREVDGDANYFLNSKCIIDLQLSIQRGVRCFGVQRQFWDMDDFRSGGVICLHDLGKLFHFFVFFLIGALRIKWEDRLKDLSLAAGP